MNLEHISFAGSKLDEESTIIIKLPDNLVSLLRQINGFVQYDGGLHVRGIGLEPEWHSLEVVFDGVLALHNSYSSIIETDIPFAEDCVGDQFLLRDGKVIKLFSETGDIEEYNFGLATFFNKASEDPVGFLGMDPLLQLNEEGTELKPGQLIGVYPPFCSVEAKNGVSLKAIDSSEVLSFLADFSKKIAGVGEGGEFSIEIIE